MAVISTFPLIDGGLSQVPLSRAQVVELMAADLERLDAFRSEADAIRALMGLKLYSTFEIMTCVDDARQAAMQIVVAREISEP